METAERISLSHVPWKLSEAEGAPGSGVWCLGLGLAASFPWGLRCQPNLRKSQNPHPWKNRKGAAPAVGPFTTERTRHWLRSMWET